MENTKDCTIIFCDKQTYDFNSKDFVKALKYCEGKPVYAIKTPWVVLTVMDPEEFDFVTSAVFAPVTNCEVPEDLIV